jgi:carbonic anhydrase
MGELERLMEGNKRFVEGTPAAKDMRARRAETRDAQAPFVTVVTCSDSRVSPEFIFDLGIGDVFVVRNAGNVLDRITLGTIEYGTEHLHTPLLVVMGHEKCGAVTAACKGGECPPNIAAIMKKLKGPVKRGKGDVEKAAIANVKKVVREIRKKSEIVRHLESEGKLAVVGMKYFFEDGRVEVIKVK